MHSVQRLNCSPGPMFSQVSEKEKISFFTIVFVSILYIIGCGERFNLSADGLTAEIENLKNKGGKLDDGRFSITAISELHDAIRPDTLVARLDPYVQLKSGDTAEFVVNMNLAHIFDRETEETIF